MKKKSETKKEEKKENKSAHKGNPFKKIVDKEVKGK